MPSSSLVLFISANSNSMTTFPITQTKAFEWSLTSLFLVHLKSNPSTNLKGLIFQIYPESNHFSPLPTINHNPNHHHLWVIATASQLHYLLPFLPPTSSFLTTTRGNCLKHVREVLCSKLWGFPFHSQGVTWPWPPLQNLPPISVLAHLSVSAGLLIQLPVSLLPVLPTSPQSFSDIIVLRAFHFSYILSPPFNTGLLQLLLPLPWKIFPQIMHLVCTLSTSGLCSSLPNQKDLLWLP